MCHVPGATGQRRVSLSVTLAPRRRQPDADAYDKVLLDSLVRCGLLCDDNAKGILGRMSVEFLRGKTSETRITLEDVE
jgi:Holliday junction resolvase RusA-like endonuclease